MNLLQNPGFEQWNNPNDAVAWTEIDPTDPQYEQKDVLPWEGDYCMMVFSYGSVSGVWQRVEVGTGVQVTAAAWIWPGPFRQDQGRVGIDPWGGIDITSDDVVWSEAAISLGWQQLNVEVASMSSHVTVFIGEPLTKDLPYFYDIDAAVLTPEPATITLLALGSLVLLRRRRG